MILTMQDNVRYGDSVKMSLERVSYDNTGKLQDITDDSEYTVKIKKIRQENLRTQTNTNLQTACLYRSLLECSR